MDIYHQQRMQYKNVMMLNNEGVRLLYNGNIERAISTFQEGTNMARNLLLSTRATILCSSHGNDSYIDHQHRHPFTPISVTDGSMDNDNSYHQIATNRNHDSIRSDYNGRLASIHRIVDRQSRHYVQQQENYEWLDMLCSIISSTSSSSLSVRGSMPMPSPHMKSLDRHRTHDVQSTSSAGIQQCCMGTPLDGWNTDMYYVHDRPFLFPHSFIEQRCCRTHCSPHDLTRPIDSAEIIRAMTVLIVNFALVYHYHGKKCGQSKSYSKAIEIYYLLWTISQNSNNLGQIYSMKDRWYATMQCILLNNLVQVHNELENYVESKICITCLYDLIVWRSSQPDKNMDDTNIWTNIDEENNVDITYERIHRMSYLKQHEFDQIMANIIYYRTPETALAA